MGVSLEQCSCSEVTPAGSKMNKLLIVALIAASANGARQLRGNIERDGKSLVNTFPFNARGNSARSQDHDHHHDHDHNDRNLAVSLDARGQRQGSDGGAPSFDDVAGARPGNDGKRCIDKVEMIEETEYDDVVQCDHSYDKRCEDETSGYTTNTKCSKWPKEVCNVSKKNVKKYTPITGC